MRKEIIEAALDEAICLLPNFPFLAFIFETKELADNAQKSLFEFYKRNKIALAMEYQTHTVKLIIYDVDMGSDVEVSVPLCEDESTLWFDGKTFETSRKVALHFGFDKIKTGFKMADYIEGLDEASIRNVYHFTAKRI